MIDTKYWTLSGYSFFFFNMFLYVHMHSRRMWEFRFQTLLPVRGPASVLCKSLLFRHVNAAPPPLTHKQAKLYPVSFCELWSCRGPKAFTTILQKIFAYMNFNIQSGGILSLWLHDFVNSLIFVIPSLLLFFLSFFCFSSAQSNFWKPTGAGFLMHLDCSHRTINNSHTWHLWMPMLSRWSVPILIIQAWDPSNAKCGKRPTMWQIWQKIDHSNQNGRGSVDLRAFHNFSISTMITHTKSMFQSRANILKLWKSHSE